MSDRPASSARIPQLNIFRRVWSFLTDQIVRDVPDEDAACEFACRVDQCTMGEWLACEHRLRTALHERRAAEAPNPPAPNSISTPHFTKSPPTQPPQS